MIDAVLMWATWILSTLMFALTLREMTVEFGGEPA